MLAPGTKIRLRNGLTVTVPMNWDATLNRAMDPTATFSGTFESSLRVSEDLEMDRISGTAPVDGVVIDSYPRTGAGSQMIEHWPVVLASTEATVSVESTDASQARVMAVQTAVPGAEYGLVIFGASPVSSYEIQLDRVWTFLGLRGVAAAQLRPVN